MKYLSHYFSFVLLLTLVACEGKKKECVEEFEIWDDVRYSQIEQEGLEEEEQIAHSFCQDLNFDEHFAPCVVISYDTAQFPAVITVDYGSGCENERGRIKSGKVIFTINSDLDSTSGTVDISLDGFTIDGYSISGNRRLTNMGRNDAGHEIISTEGVVIGRKEDWVRTRVFKHVREWVAGEETCDIRDDEYHYTGSWTVEENGESSHALIVEPIIWTPGTCDHATMGVIDVNAGLLKAKIDYGDGTCDNQATVTIAGRTYEENLDKDHCED